MSSSHVARKVGEGERSKNTGRYPNRGQYKSDGMTMFLRKTNQRQKQVGISASLANTAEQYRESLLHTAI
jgi:hypothetical protein